MVLDYGMHSFLQSHPQLRGQLLVGSVVNVAIEATGFIDPSHGSCCHSDLEVDPQYGTVVRLLLDIWVPHSLCSEREGSREGGTKVGKDGRPGKKGGGGEYRGRKEGTG